MDWDRVMQLAIAMPVRVWRIVYPYLMSSARTSPMPGLQFQAKQKDMLNGTGLLQRVGVDRKSLRRALNALQAMKLITVTQFGTDKPVIAIQALSERHHAELLKALDAIQGEKAFVDALQDGPDEHFWSDVAPAFKGDLMSARELLSDDLRSQMLLFETGEPWGSSPPTWGSSPHAWGSSPHDGGLSPHGGPIFDAPVRSTSDVRGACSSAASGAGEKDGVVLMQRRTKEEVARRRKATADRKAKGEKAIRTAIADGAPADLSIETKSGTVEAGVTKEAHREPKSTTKGWKTTDERYWPEIHRELQLMFGDDVIEVWEDDTVHPNPENTCGVHALKILGFLVDGFRNGNWGKHAYYRPSAECFLASIRAFRLWTTRFYGVPCGPESTEFIRKLIYRTREQAKTRVPQSRILRAVAGLGYQIVQCKVADKPQFLPNDTKWLSMFTGTMWRTLSDKYAKGVSCGHVPHDPQEWLERLPEGELMLAEKAEVEHLLNVPKSGTSKWVDRLGDF